MIPIKDKQFLKYLSNTIKTLKNSNFKELNELKYIQKNEKLDVVSVCALYSTLKSREVIIDFLKETQDEHAFKRVSEEHTYMKNFIKRYFDIGDTSSQNHINFYVGKKDSIR